MSGLIQFHQRNFGGEVHLLEGYIGGRFHLVQGHLGPLMQGDLGGRVAWLDPFSTCRTQLVCLQFQDRMVDFNSGEYDRQF